MSKSTLDIYRTLGPEQLQFANSKTIDATMKMKRWFDFMVPIAQMDKNNDESRRKKNKIIGWSIAGIVVGIVLTVLFFPLILFLIFILVVLIINILRLQTLKKLDIGNHLRLFLMPFIIVMKEECEGDAKTRIKFDATHPVNPKKIVNSKKYNPNGRGLPEITATFYNHPWLDADFLMAEGTALHIECVDSVEKRRIKKRGSSGKIKYKTKLKIKHRIEIKMSFVKAKYNLAERNPAYEYIDHNDYHLFKAKHKLESLNTEQSIPVQQVLSMIAGAYQNVRPVG
jgi:hypothetical protein